MNVRGGEGVRKKLVSTAASHKIFPMAALKVEGFDVHGVWVALQGAHDKVKKTGIVVVLHYSPLREAVVREWCP